MARSEMGTRDSGKRSRRCRSDVEAIAKETGYALKLGEKVVTASDNFPFFMEGVPAITMLAKDNDRALGRGFAHTAMDTLDKVNERDMKECAMVAARVLLRLAARRGFVGRHRKPEEIKEILIAQELEEGLRAAGQMAVCRMKPISLFQTGKYSNDWIKDFYDHARRSGGIRSASRRRARHARATRLNDCAARGQNAFWNWARVPARRPQRSPIWDTPSSQSNSAHCARVLRARTHKNSAPGSFTDSRSRFLHCRVERRALTWFVVWETFGLGSDADQRRLLKRIAREWLARTDRS